MKIRYRLASFYLIAGLCLSMAALFNGIGVYNKYLFGLEGKRKCEYPSEAELEISGVKRADWETFEQIWQRDMFGDVNVKLDGIRVRSNTSGSSWRLTVLVSSHIPERIWQTNGDRIHLDGDTPSVAAGRYRADYARSENGEKYIYLENQNRFLLAEELGFSDSDYLDTMLVMRWESLPKEWREELLLENPMTLRLQSESYLTNDFVNEAAALLSDCFQGCSISAVRKTAASSENVYLRSSELSVPVWMYIFCAAILVQVSAFWVKARKKEVLIRRIFGYSYGKILLFLARQLLLLFAAALILYILAQTLITRSIIRLHAADIWVGIIYMAATMGLCLILPGFYLRSWQCTELLNER